MCDYLFFYSVSCSNPELRRMYSKALFAMLKNYSYRWKLGLSHVYTALDNLGMDMTVPRDEHYFRVMLSSRLDTVRRSSRLAGLPRKKFSMPKTAAFYVARLERARQPESEEDFPEGVFLETIKSFVGLLSDLLASHLDRTDFKPLTDDWTAQLILLYVVFLVATDHKLITCARVSRHVLLLLHCQLDSFSTFQWTGLYRDDTLSHPSDHNSANDAVCCASCDVTEVLAQVGGCHARFNQLRTWDPAELPRGKNLAHFEDHDHHHNMTHRLDLLPPSLRGNMVKKGVAFLNLQYLIDPGKRGTAQMVHNSLEKDTPIAVSDDHVLVTEKFVDELNSILNLEQNLLKLRVLYGHMYVMYNLIKIVDAIVGKESDDFALSRLDKIKAVRRQNANMCKTTTSFNLCLLFQIEEILSDYVKRRVKMDDVNGIWVKELIGQVTSKWKILTDRHHQSLDEFSGRRDM